jgi:hypothetical protein
MNNKTVTTKQILDLVDEMAACTSNLNHQTYESFIAAREKLKQILEDIDEDKVTIE